MEYDALIVDGNNILYKSLFVTRNPKETINIFISQVNNIVSKFGIPLENMYVAWDKKTGSKKSFRFSLIPDYKGGRSEMCDSDKERVNDCQKALTALITHSGGVSLFPRHMEADDVIGHFVNSDVCSGKNVLLMSADKDFCQLISNDNCNLSIAYNFKKDGIDILDKYNFEDILGVSAENFLLYKAIKGDNSDNISGLKSYGHVRSARLAAAFSENKENLAPEDFDILKRNRRVMDIAKGYTYQTGEKEYLDEQLVKAVSRPNQEEYESVIVEWNIRDLWKNTEIKRINEEDVASKLEMWAL